MLKVIRFILPSVYDNQDPLEWEVRAAIEYIWRKGQIVKLRVGEQKRRMTLNASSRRYISLMSGCLRLIMINGSVSQLERSLAS